MTLPRLLDAMALFGMIISAVFFFWHVGGWTLETLGRCISGVARQKEIERAAEAAAASRRRDETEPVSDPYSEGEKSALEGHRETPSGDGQQGLLPTPGRGREEGRKEGGE